MKRKKNRLTPRQTKLLTVVTGQIVKNGRANLTKAGLETYDTDNPGSAAVMASNELKKPHVEKKLQEILNEKGIGLDQVAENLAHVANMREGIKFTGDQVLKSNVEILKLLNAYPSKTNRSVKVNIKGNLKDLDFKDLDTSLSKLRTNNDSLNKDIK
jgi:hypothetical protein